MLCSNHLVQRRSTSFRDDTEFGNQATQSVKGRGTLFDEALPGAVQAQDDLLVFFFDGNKAHVCSGDCFADGGSVLCVVLATFAAHAVGRDKLWRHGFGGVAVFPK